MRIRKIKIFFISLILVTSTPSLLFSQFDEDPEILFFLLHHLCNKKNIKNLILLKGQFSSAYDNQPETTQLTFDKLTKLPNGIFNGFVKLEKLQLTFLELTTLPEGIFDDLSNLKNLYLSNNQFTTLPEEIFNGLVKLENLYLDNNPFIRFPENMNLTLPNIQKITLGNGRSQPIKIPIKESARDAFRNKLYEIFNIQAEENINYIFVDPKNSIEEIDYKMEELD